VGGFELGNVILSIHLKFPADYNPLFYSRFGPSRQRLPHSASNLAGPLLEKPNHDSECWSQHPTVYRDRCLVAQHIHQHQRPLLAFLVLVCAKSFNEWTGCDPDLVAGLSTIRFGLALPSFNATRDSTVTKGATLGGSLAAGGAFRQTEIRFARQ
jgi:hypothetical protein